MTIIEALKERKTIEKRIHRNKEQILKYASMASFEKPYFADQKKEVEKLIQANIDLISRYVELSIRIEYTNIAVKTKIFNSNRSLSELLILQRKGCSWANATFHAMSDQTGAMALSRYPSGGGSSEAKAHVERYYDESFKNRLVREWSDFEESISPRLENINATTELLELPEELKE